MPCRILVDDFLVRLRRLGVFSFLEQHGRQHRPGACRSENQGGIRVRTAEGAAHVDNGIDDDHGARGGHGGNNGIRSIIETTGSDEFRRLRIGIGRPVVNGKPSYEPDVVADYVLSDPSPDERDLLDEAVERAIEAIEMTLAEDIDQAMAQFN